MSKYYHVEVNGKPLESMGIVQVYTPGEAIMKTRIFGGKVTPLSEEENAKEEMKASLINLKDAFCQVFEASDFEKEFNDKYPFDMCFAELTDKVIDWVKSEVEQICQAR